MFDAFFYPFLAFLVFIPFCVLSLGIRIAGEPIMSPPAKNAKGSKFCPCIFLKKKLCEQWVNSCKNVMMEKLIILEKWRRYGEKDVMKITNTSASVIKYSFSKKFPSPQ